MIIGIEHIWFAVGLALGVVLAVMGMLVGVWMDDRRENNR